MQSNLTLVTEGRSVIARNGEWQVVRLQRCIEFTEGNEYAYYFDCGDGFTGIYVYDKMY